MNLNENEINKFINNIVTLFKIKGLHPSKEAVEVSKRLFKDDITSEEAIKIINNKYKI